MRISVIIPTMKSQQFLAQTLSGLQKSLPKVIMEVVIVINQGDLETIDAVKTYNDKFYFPIRLLITASEGQHENTLRGIIASESDYVLTVDDDTIFTDEEIERKLLLNEPKPDELIFLILPKYSKRARFKLWIVSRVINYVAKVPFKLTKGSSIRFLDKRLLMSNDPLKNDFIYLDALLPCVGYHARTLETNFTKIQHSLKRYTNKKRFLLVWNTLKHYSF